MCVCVGGMCMQLQCPRRPDKDVRGPGTRIIRSCELADMGAGNRISFSGRVGHNSPLSHLSSPVLVLMFQDKTRQTNPRLSWPDWAASNPLSPPRPTLPSFAGVTDMLLGSAFIRSWRCELESPGFAASTLLTERSPQPFTYFILDRVSLWMDETLCSWFIMNSQRSDLSAPMCWI